ncbi:MAG: hypothetical protein KA736_06060 [Crocinitomicaceae bacterium]|nr:hypothetical protein [Crocinitomicaceae bacterium]MBP6032079.1 hypothetical protein [Crocinitomicaceae bacterium]
MRVILYCCLVLSLINSSCQDSNPTVPVDQITVAEDVVLGIDIDSLYKFFKKSGVNTQTFNKDGENISFYVTDVFDLSSYRNSNIHLNHVGLFYPIKLTGTNRLIGLKVLLASTHESNLQNSEYLNNLTIKQEVNEQLLSEIENMYTKKYGKPSRVKLNYYPVYQIEGNQVKKYEGTPSKCEIVTWQNEYLTIDFHKGFKSYETSFDPSNICYLYTYFYGGDAQQINPIGGNIFSYSLPYISYELKDTTVKILGLEKKMKL